MNQIGEEKNNTTMTAAQELVSNTSLTPRHCDSKLDIGDSCISFVPQQFVNGKK